MNHRALFLGILLSFCVQAGAQVTPPPATRTFDPRDYRSPQKELVNYQLHDRWVKPEAKKKLVDAFPEHFQVINYKAPLDLKTIGGCEQKIDVANLQEKIDSMGTAVPRAIVFHYGIDPLSNNFVLAVSLVQLTFLVRPGDGDYGYDCEAPTSRFYLLSNKKLYRQNDAKAALDKWRDTYLTGDNAYRERVKIERADGIGNDDALKGFDTESDMFPYEFELWPFFEHNKDEVTLVVSCMTEPREEGVGDTQFHYRHGLILHLLDKDDNPLLDPDDHPGDVYQGKAANIGSMCPPRCKRWRFPIAPTP